MTRFLDPKDASALALVAEHPGMPADLFERILKSVKNKEARSIALVMASRWRARKPPTKRTIEAAEELLDWVSRNRREYEEAMRIANS